MIKHDRAHLLARIACAFGVAAAMYAWEIPPARANVTCETPRKNSALPESEKSRFVARALIAHVQKTWEIVANEKPIEVSMSLTDDPSGNGTEIEFHLLRFKNFEAGFFRNEDSVVMPSELTTKSPKFDLPCGLKIGQSQAQVKALLGTSTYQQQESFIYATGGDQNGEVIFSFSGGKLRQVSWTYDTH